MEAFSFIGDQQQPGFNQLTMAPAIPEPGPYFTSGLTHVTELFSNPNPADSYAGPDSGEYYSPIPDEDDLLSYLGSAEWEDILRTPLRVDSESPDEIIAESKFDIEEVWCMHDLVLDYVPLDLDSVLLEPDYVALKPESHYVPHEPHCVPFEPHRVPLEPHCVPLESESHYVPPKPHYVPLDLESVLLNPHCVPLEPRCVPLEPHCVPLDLDSVLLDLDSVPLDLGSVLLEPHCVPLDLDSVLLDLDSVPLDLGSVLLEPHCVPLKPHCVPLEPEFHYNLLKPKYVALEPDSVLLGPDYVPLELNYAPPGFHYVALEQDSVALVPDYVPLKLDYVALELDTIALERDYVPPDLSRSLTRSGLPSYSISHPAAASLQTQVPVTNDIRSRRVSKKKGKPRCEIRISKKIQREKKSTIKKVWLGTFDTEVQADRALDVGKYFFKTGTNKKYSDPRIEALLSTISNSKQLQAEPLDALVASVRQLAKHYAYHGTLL